jgi:integral membrane protein (TIGR00529 family)
MIELIKLGVVFLFLIVLIKKKVPVGLTLFFGGIFLGILFKLSFLSILKNLFQACIEFDTLHLLGMVLLITILGNLLQYTENMKNLTQSLEHLFKNVKVVLTIIPAMVGLLPMPGGAMMSAPMVEEIGKERALSPEIKTGMNYWFRHIFEFVFPLYPGIVMSATLLETTISKVVEAQFVLNLLMIIYGTIFVTTKIKVSSVSYEEVNFWKSFSKLTLNFSPILFVVILNLGFKIDLLLALPLTLIGIVLYQKVNLKTFGSLILKSLTFEIVSLIFGIMIFKKIIEGSGAVQVIPQTLISWGLPSVFLVAVIPFIVGLLTGMTTAFIGISYPILLGFLSNSGVNFGNAMLLYAAGFTGVMLSPVHLCLVLSREYFKAEWGKTYRLIILPSLLVLATAIILNLLGYPWGRI